MARGERARSGRTRPFLCAVLLGALLAPMASDRAVLGAAPTFPLALSPDGTYVVDRAGQPFFVNGDTAWSILVQLSPAEVDTYLADRAAKGVNAILVNLLEHKFAGHAPANAAGQGPFTTAGDFASPNEAYFTNVDDVLRKANDKGIVVLLDALYLGYDCGDEGFCAEAKTSSPAAIRAYGRFLGKRYGRQPNIVWVVGGDTDPVSHGVGTHLRELVAGIREGDTTHLVTAHNGPEQSAMDVWAGEAWLGLNDVYTYDDTYKKALTEYGRGGAKPFFLMESAYENEHNSTPAQLRREAYQAVLSGAVVGHLFGNCPMWHFNAASAAKFCSAGRWQDQLSSPGSTTVALVGRIVTSRRFHLLQPDATHTAVTGGVMAGVDYAAAARAKDGSSILVYVPSPRTLTVDLTKLAGSLARGWWVNPRDATSSSIGTFPTSGPRTFTPPGPDDWILVLDDASLDFPAPGTR